MVAYMAADGSYIRPCLVIHGKTLNDELLLLGFTSEKMEIYTQPNSFPDTESFNDWFRDTSIPDLVGRRERFSYQGPAFLIADSCSAHRREEFDALCRIHRVVPIWLPSIPRTNCKCWIFVSSLSQKIPQPRQSTRENKH
jgi:hypothetical protein